jgi:hypothetical protein
MRLLLIVKGLVWIKTRKLKEAAALTREANWRRIYGDNVTIKRI